jgi:DnaJ-class molecular chaperone
MKTRSFYEVLGVKRSASAHDIRASFRILARRYHPDVSEDPNGERKFKEAVEAYQTLREPETRSAYDRSLSPCLPSGWSEPGQVAMLGWLLWVHWWAGWERAWLQAMDARTGIVR